MELIEMFVDENEEQHGIDAVAVVEDPAIASEWVALKDHVKLAEVDKEKQILMGALLVPDKPIYRNQDGKEFYIFFRRETIRKIRDLYMKRGKQNNTSEEHEIKLQGNTVVEIWEKEHMVHDKSALHDLNDPIGSLMITMSVPDKTKYNEFKNSKTGFSLEGYFTDKLTLKRTPDEILIDKIKEKKIEVIVLDEAHHLKTEWWKSLIRVTNSLDNITIIRLFHHSVFK